jgi:L-ascorbate metabolism protein UlaG (beta-lactamase superfamily)
MAVGVGLVTLASLAGVFLTTSGCAAFGEAPAGARLERVAASRTYLDGKFQNEEPSKSMTIGEWLSRTPEFLFGNDQMRVPICALPMYAATADQLRVPPSSGLRVTWFGHSTTLIEIDGRAVLTDPMWSERASPSTLAGPRRFHPPPLPIERLPPVDAVLISHDHYDHLDMPTVQALAARGATFHVPLGVGAHLESWGVRADQIAEYEWWESRSLPGGVQVISTPSRHFSGRGLRDRNSTLWTSWAVVGPKHRVYFSGDTGPTPALKTIAERLGPFDLSLLEIGQWHSRSENHLGPVGALEAHQALGASRLMPIHWATFALGMHAWSEPAETLVLEGSKRGLQVLTPMIGEPIEPTAPVATGPWWRALPPSAPQCPGKTAVTQRSLDDWPL